MNILFINGSPRKRGFTMQIMQCIAENIDTIHKKEWVHTYDLKIHPCISCLHCRPDQVCSLPVDDGHAVWNKIRSADVLVIGSPTYFGNMSGPLKTLIDRCLTGFEELAKSGLEMPIPLHRGKKAAMVTACNIPAPFSQLPNHAGGTLKAIETVLLAGGFDIVGSIILDAAASKTEIPVEIQEEAVALGQQLTLG